MVHVTCTKTGIELGRPLFIFDEGYGPYRMGYDFVFPNCCASLLGEKLEKCCFSDLRQNVDTL